MTEVTVETCFVKFKSRVISEDFDIVAVVSTIWEMDDWNYRSDVTDDIAIIIINFIYTRW